MERSVAAAAARLVSETSKFGQHSHRTCSPCGCRTPRPSRHWSRSRRRWFATAAESLFTREQPVVNVFDEMMNNVSAGSRPRVASTKSAPSRRYRCSARYNSASEALLNVSEWMLWLSVAAALLALRQLDLLRLRALVGNLAQQVRDDVQPGPPLVVRPRDIPRRPGSCRWLRTSRRARANSRTSGCRTSGPSARASRSCGHR